MQLTPEQIMQDPGYRALGIDKLLKKLVHDGQYQVANNKDLELRLRTLVRDDPLNQMAKRPRGLKPELRITAPPGSWQIDVVVIPKRRYPEGRNGEEMFLMLIEIPSRYVWARPITDASMVTILKVYEEFVVEQITQDSNPLVRIYADKAFNNTDFRAYNSVLQIQVFTSVAEQDHITKYGDFMGILDRCVRTLRDYLQKYMLRVRRRWADVLQDVIDLYNDTPNESLSIPPPEEGEEEEAESLIPGWVPQSDVQETPKFFHEHFYIMRRRYKQDLDFNTELLKEHNNFFDRFKVGDRVRYLIATYKKFSDKKYIPRYTRGIFVVVAKDGNKYLLRPLGKRGQADILKRRFAVPELVKATGTGLDPSQEKLMITNPDNEEPEEDEGVEDVESELEDQLGRVDKNLETQTNKSRHLRKMKGKGSKRAPAGASPL